MNKTAVRYCFILIAMISIILANAIMVSPALIGVAADYQTSLSGVELQEEYEYGSEFSVPEGSIVIDGKTLKAKAAIVFPDGNAYSLDRVKLDCYGKYKIIYSVTYQNHNYYEEKSFIVLKPFVGFSASGKNSAFYGSHSKAPGVNGLVVSMDAGKTLTLNKPTNLSNYTADDIFFNLFVVPTQVGTPDFTVLEIKMTDVYNPANYITIKVQAYNSDATAHSYILAGAPNQPLTGYEYSKKKLHVNNAYGTVTGFAFAGKPANPTLSANVLSLYYDYMDSKIACGTRLAQLIVDFDDSTYFNNLWKGFATGDVMISITPKEGSVANFVITKIGDLDLSATVASVSPSEIVVDFGDYTEDALPRAQVGRPYQIFPAIAKNAEGETFGVVKSVIFNKSTSAEAQIKIENNAFTPEREGKYYIIYESYDFMGSRTEKVVTINAVKELNPIVIEFISPILQGPVGDYVEMAEAVVTGNEGTYTLEKKVVHKASGEEFAIKDNSFRALRGGICTVTYTVTDYSGRSFDNSYEVDISVFDDPIFDNTVTLPKYLIDGYRYVLPVITAIDYKTVTYSSAKIEVTDEDGTRDIENNTYIPKVAASGDTVQIKYYSVSPTGYTELIYQRPVYKVADSENNVDLTKLFIADSGITATAQEEFITFTSSSSNKGFNLINAMLSDNTELLFDASDVGIGINIILSDYEDSELFVKFTYTLNGGSFYFSVNGSSPVKTNYSQTAPITLKFNNSAMTVRTDDTNYNLASYGFKGFVSNKNYVRFELIGAGEVNLIKINGQPFTSFEKDFIKPQLIINGIYGGQKEYGSIADVFSAMAVDVVTGDVEVRVSVRRADESYATAIDGTLLNNVTAKGYQILCDQYGVFYVTFVSEDFYGNKTTVYFTINIPDDVPPVMTVNGFVPASASVGDTITLPTATSVDDKDGDCGYGIYVFSPNGRWNKLKGSALKVELKGEYKVVYMSYDKSFSPSYETYTIKVV